VRGKCLGETLTTKKDQEADFKLQKEPEEAGDAGSSEAKKLAAEVDEPEEVLVHPKHMDATCFGYCASCEKVHELRIGASLEYAQNLLEQLEREGRLDFDAPPSKQKKKFTIENLFPGDRSHMLGVLECRNEKGEIVWLKAYSSLPGGYRKVPGWVPMIISKEDFEKSVKPIQNKIKELTQQIETFGAGAIRGEQLSRKRKRYSQDLQTAMPSLYTLYNYRQQKRKLKDVFYGNQGMPGGIGECCAPKLLNHAARKKLTPVSLAEFFWGKKNKDGKREKALFRICCKSRCQPIMGFMLCGLEPLDS